MNKTPKEQETEFEVIKNKKALEESSDETQHSSGSAQKEIQKNKKTQRFKSLSALNGLKSKM